jgi:hypothetical protein
MSVYWEVMNMKAIGWWCAGWIGFPGKIRRKREEKISNQRAVVLSDIYRPGAIDGIGWRKMLFVGKSGRWLMGG